MYGLLSAPKVLISYLFKRILGWRFTWRIVSSLIFPILKKKLVKHRIKAIFITFGCLRSPDSWASSRARPCTQPWCLTFLRLPTWRQNTFEKWVDGLGFYKTWSRIQGVGVSRWCRPWSGKGQRQGACVVQERLGHPKWSKHSQLRCRCHFLKVWRLHVCVQSLYDPLSRFALCNIGPHRGRWLARLGWPPASSRWCRGALLSTWSCSGAYNQLLWSSERDRIRTFSCVHLWTGFEEHKIRRRCSPSSRRRIENHSRCPAELLGTCIEVFLLWRTPPSSGS